MKTFFIFLIFNCSLLIGSANAQWWVRGGNLLWPYGNVEIEKDLSVGGVVTFDSTVNYDDSVNYGASVSFEGTTYFSSLPHISACKEYIAFVDFQTLDNPSVGVIFNTIDPNGITVTNDGLSDVTFRLSSANSAFSEFTTPINIIYNDGSASYYLIGGRLSDDVVEFVSYTSNGGGTQAITSGRIFIHLKVYQ
ncbi:MAG: hypothetical protein D8M26_13495 [Ignavibacteriae bacterium]|nr:hypothetical protein [Ignavibacteriota bacterium]MCE7855089.1 hypothetical protein [Ignavibacteria bacterium CHB3]GJQ42659.1 MAG: hypothetical protein JETCAE03_21570 [Ignavibacteriaceae bacterium]